MTIDELLPTEAFALTLWGEARGESVEGQIAVAWVVLNRYKSNSKYRSVKDVVLEPKQFSCWNENDPNREKLLKIAEQFKRDIIDRELRQCNWIAEGMIKECIKDNTRGAVNYMTTSLFHSNNRPKWAFAPKTDPINIGNHTFFTA